MSRALDDWILQEQYRAEEAMDAKERYIAALDKERKAWTVFSWLCCKRKEAEEEWEDANAELEELKEAANAERTEATQAEPST